MSVEDTGGYYFDRDTGVVGVVNRNVSEGLDRVRSGRAGGEAAMVVVGGLALFGLKRAWDEVS